MLVNHWGSIRCLEKVGNVMILKNRGGTGGTSSSEVKQADFPGMARTADLSARTEVLGRDDKVEGIKLLAEGSRTEIRGSSTPVGKKWRTVAQNDTAILAKGEKHSG